MNLRHFNTIVFFALLGAVTWGAWLLFAPFVSAIFMAATLAILFYPMYERVRVRCGARARVAAGIMVAMIALTIILPIVGISALVIGEVRNAVQTVSVDQYSATTVVQRVNDFVQIVPGLTEYMNISQDRFANMAQQAGSFFVTLVQKTYATAAGSMLGIFVLFFTLFYLFVDGKRLMEKLMFLSPLSDQHERVLFESFSAMSRATIKGTLIIGIIQGSLGAVAFFIAGVPSVLIWWVLMVFFAVIPFLGAGVLGFPFALYYIITGNTVAGGILLVSFVAIALLDNYLRPLIVGRNIQMHTLLIFFATIGGIMAFGLIGFIVGPIIMALFVTLWQIYALEFKAQLTAYNRGKGE